MGTLFLTKYLDFDTVTTLKGQNAFCCALQASSCTEQIGSDAGTAQTNFRPGVLRYFMAKQDQTRRPSESTFLHQGSAIPIFALCASLTAVHCVELLYWWQKKQIWQVFYHDVKDSLRKTLESGIRSGSIQKDLIVSLPKLVPTCLVS